MEFVPVTNKIPENSVFRRIHCQAILLCGATLFLTPDIGRKVHSQEARNQLPLVTQSNSQAERLYRGVLTDIESADFDRAAAGIAKLRTEHSGVLVPVEAQHHIEVTLLADILSSRLPERIDQHPDPPEWTSRTGHALWRQQLLGRIAPEKLLSTGDRFWREGEITRAKLFWRLSQSAVHTEIRTQTSSEVLKRQIVAAIFEGRFRQAQIKLDQFKISFPEITGRIAGEEGNLVEILEQLTETLQESESDSLVESNSIFPSETGRIDFVRRMWSVGASRRSIKSNLIPQLWNEIVLLQDENGVRALNSKTGNSAWPVDEQDEGFIFETRAAPTRSDQARLAVGRGVIHDDMWYGRTGVAGFTENQGLKSVEQSRVTTLNLLAEGRLEWTVTADSLTTHRDDTGRVFSGDPIIAQGRLYVPLRSPAPSNRLQIACMDLSDGSEIWTTDVSASLNTAPSDEVSFHDQLVFAEGCFFWSIHGQEVCCVDATSGNVNWISGVEFHLNLKQTSSEDHHGLIVSEGRVFATTINGIASFDLYTGELLWEQNLQEPPHSLLGVNDGLLITSSPHLQAMDVQTGRISWQHQVEDSRKSRGKLLGHSVIWPTNDELWTVDSQTSRILQRDFFSNLTGQPMYDIQIHNAILIADEGDQITFYRINRSH